MKAKGLVLVAGIGVALLGGAKIATADSFKVGIIESKVLLEDSPQAKAAQARIEKEFKPRQESLAKRESQLKEKLESYERDKAVLSDKDRISQEREISRLQQEFQRLGQELAFDVQTKQRDELERFQKTMEQAVEKVAKSQSLNVVIPSHLAVYNSSSADVTKQVMKALEDMAKK
jgi:outer membrane protein